LELKKETNDKEETCEQRKRRCDTPSLHWSQSE
jgi:hypothetical protein